jgi:hypothetical protein
MPDNERARIRQIMYEPSSVWLATENSGERWLTDQYVLYNVTGAEVLSCYDTSYDTEWPDGPYQLMASGDWRMKERDSVPEPDIETYLGIMASHTWYRAVPSDWSVAEHPGKAMLWSVMADAACLLGESTWTAVKRHYPDCVVSYAFNRKAGVFRFEDMGMTFAYAAGIQVPEGQEHVAAAIAAVSAGGSYSPVLDSTSN